MSPIAPPEHAYSDGHPFDSVRHMESTILLKPKHAIGGKGAHDRE